LGGWRTNFFGNVERGQQGPLLVARGARAALLAGEGDKHLVLAVRAADSGEPFLQIAALQEGRYSVRHNRQPIDVLGLGLGCFIAASLEHRVEEIRWHLQGID